MHKDSCILITGAVGMVGSALVRHLKYLGFKNILMPDSKELDLRNQEMVYLYFAENEIEYVFHLAAKVGGINANINFPAEFLYDNIIMGCNVINSARKYGVKKLLFLGSSCIFPKNCRQPMKETDIMTGPLEPTNEGYAFGKLSILKMCEMYNKQFGTNFISLMPCNIYGIGDHFDLERSHVMGALITKFHNAKINNLPSVEIWGSGKAKREFIFVDDVIEAIMFFMEKCNVDDISPFVNIGTGQDITINELAHLISSVIGYKGKIIFNKDKPEGMLRKCLDVTKARKLGWKAEVQLMDGLEKTYDWYVKNENK